METTRFPKSAERRLKSAKRVTRKPAVHRAMPGARRNDSSCTSIELSDGRKEKEKEKVRLAGKLVARISKRGR
jgi:hypothetical protein